MGDMTPDGSMVVNGLEVVLGDDWSRICPANRPTARQIAAASSLRARTQFRNTRTGQVCLTVENPLRVDVWLVAPMGARAHLKSIGVRGEVL